MNRRVLALVMVFVMILTLSPVPAYGADDPDSGHISTIGSIDVTEQFNLTPGGTYYFDLSEQGFPGSVDENLPDSSLKWVPFTYVGTINAYSRTSPGVSTEEDISVSERSLFVADHNVAFGVCWNDLNVAGLLFGKNYISGGVSYKFRSLSTGSDFYRTPEDEVRGLPVTNEWDQILNKNESYIKNLSVYYTLGQDTYKEETLRCTARGHQLSARGYFAPGFDEIISLNDQEFGWRPVLEILNPGTLGADGLKTVTFDMGSNGTLGNGDLTSATVVYTDKLTLPEITPENGFNYTGSGAGPLGWYDGNTFYEPGTTITIDNGVILKPVYRNTYYTINVSAGSGGTIYPGVDLHVPEGTSADFMIIPDSGYYISSVIIDGHDIGSETR